MTEQREAFRKRAYMAAYVCATDGGAPVFCLVRDMSAGGARIGLAGPDALPTVFDLHVSGSRRVYRAEVVWRRPAEVGVRFLAKGRAPDVARLDRAS